MTTAISRVIAVSGSNGYLGSHIVDMLEARCLEWKKFSVVRLVSAARAGSAKKPCVEDMRRELRGTEVLVHVANCIWNHRNDDRFAENTVRMAEWTVEAARDAGVRRVVWTSSDMCREDAQDAYGRAKFLALRTARAVLAPTAVELCVVAPAFCLGEPSPRQKNAPTSTWAFYVAALEAKQRGEGMDSPAFEVEIADVERVAAVHADLVAQPASSEPVPVSEGIILSFPSLKMQMKV